MPISRLLRRREHGDPLRVLAHRSVLALATCLLRPVLALGDDDPAMTGFVQGMGGTAGGESADRAPGVPLAGGVAKAIEPHPRAVARFQGFAGEFKRFLRRSMNLDVVSLHKRPPVLRERSHRHPLCKVHNAAPDPGIGEKVSRIRIIMGLAPG